MTYEPTLTWHISLPLTDLPIGPALTAEQREIEERIGVTHEILWAYAEAIPKLLGEFIMQDIQPLGFGRGALVAIATEVPVRLPHVRFVQTSSVDVCREMGSFVPEFHIKGQACLDELLQSGSAVKKVWVRDCRSFDVQAPFEVVFLEVSDSRPSWRIRFGHDHLLRLAVIDNDAWLCWDRDERRPVIDVDHNEVPGRFGPRDVAPEKAPPPWAPVETFALGGTGWAATMLSGRISQTEDQVFATPDRRFLLLHSFPGYPGHQAVVQAWRDKKPLRPALEGTKTWSVGADLELFNDRAQFHWVGLQRVLRIRNGQIEQLTTDHDLRWQVAQSNPELLASFDASPAAQYKNIVVTSIGTHDMAEGSCDVLPDDRFVLLNSSAHERLLAAAPEDLGAQLSRQDIRDVAHWAAHALREEDGTMRHPALFVDANATVTIAPWYDEPGRLRPERAVSTKGQIVTPSVRDLVERPKEFHGRRIRTRGIFRCIFEGMTFADAWFDCATRLPMGLWLVEVNGIWSADGSQYGHFGFYNAHLRGDAQLISIREPRPIAADRIRFSRPYVPLITEVTIERRLQGFTYDGRWLTRLGADGRLPEPQRPDSCRARIVYANTAFHALCLFSWTFLDEPKPLVPEVATADKPGPRGRYVELKGTLKPNGSNWPLLDGALRIVPPPMSLTSSRYPMPQSNVQEAMKAWLGDGKTVRIVGEVGTEAKIVYAFSVESRDGPFEFSAGSGRM